MAKTQIKKYNFIFETTSVNSRDDIKILEETKLPNGNSKIAASALFQEAETRNSNSRYYTNSICESIVSQLSPKATSRSLLMEIDHPLFVSSDQNVLKRRASIVEINNCGGLIREISFADRKVGGIFETLSGFKGPDLYNIIMRDKVDVGFSLRALGAVEQLQDGTILVKDPIKPITYDIVSNPSHTTARVLEFLPENVTEFMSEHSVIYEAADIEMLDLDHILVADSTISLTEFFDDIYKEKFSEVISRISFNI